MKSRQHMPLDQVPQEGASGRESPRWGGLPGQGGGMGMSDVRALIAGGSPDAAMDMATSGSVSALPFQAPLARSLGAGVGDVSAFRGPQVDLALGLMGARAAEHEGNVLLPSTGVSPSLVGEEAVHVLQGEQVGRSGGAGQTSRPTDGAEREARAAGDLAAKGLPVGALQEPLRAGVNRSWLGDAWDGASSAVSGAASWVGDKASAAWEGTKSVASSAWEGTKDLASSAYHGLTDWHFEGRDARNNPQPTQEELTAADTQWTKLPQSMAAYHQNGGADDLKYVHPDGREAVIDGDTHQPMTDPRYKGTYNYCNPMALSDVHGVGDAFSLVGRSVGHFFADMLPYYIGGNVRGPG